MQAFFIVSNEEQEGCVHGRIGLRARTTGMRATMSIAGGNDDDACMRSSA
ncbi:MAG: hypothetical protein ACKO9V_02985 [Candidatus Kapaibacterium sp.]